MAIITPSAMMIVSQVSAATLNAVSLSGAAQVASIAPIAEDAMNQRLTWSSLAMSLRVSLLMTREPPGGA
jgi:hypothetical protein